jgi:ABC-type multidrug transport system fused ATPase/permease subunit
MPTLFSGCSVRENLDIFGVHSEEDIATVHSEEDIATALKDVHLHEAVTELPQRYDSLVAEGGSNFSVKQRQLLRLARAN